MKCIVTLLFLQRYNCSWQNEHDRLCCLWHAPTTQVREDQSQLLHSIIIVQIEMKWVVTSLFLQQYNCSWQNEHDRLCCLWHAPTTMQVREDQSQLLHSIIIVQIEMKWVVTLLFLQQYNCSWQNEYDRLCCLWHAPTTPIMWLA